MLESNRQKMGTPPIPATTPGHAQTPSWNLSVEGPGRQDKGGKEGWPERATHRPKQGGADARAISGKEGTKRRKHLFMKQPHRARISAPCSILIVRPEVGDFIQGELM